MADDFIWDDGKLEQGRRIIGSGYIIGSIESQVLATVTSCDICGSDLASVKVRFVRIGGGEMVTGGFVQSGWVWCPICRERRAHGETGMST